jgi:hypothetical protein
MNFPTFMAKKFYLLVDGNEAQSFVANESKSDKGPGFLCCSFKFKEDWTALLKGKKKNLRYLKEDKVLSTPAYAGSL